MLMSLGLVVGESCRDLEPFVLLEAFVESTGEAGNALASRELSRLARSLFACFSDRWTIPGINLNFLDELLETVTLLLRKLFEG